MGGAGPLHAPNPAGTASAGVAPPPRVNCPHARSFRPRRAPTPRSPAPPRGPAAAARAFRSHRPGPCPRPRGPDRRHARGGQPFVAHPLGAARHRQDHDRPPSCAGDRPRLRADLGDLHRRAGAEEGLRSGQAAPPAGQGDASVRRRDPPFQQGPAGRLPAAYGRRHHPARRRHYREPEFRTERRASVARPGHRAGAALAGQPRTPRPAGRARA